MDFNSSRTTQRSFHAGSSIQSLGCDGAAAATEVYQLPNDSRFPALPNTREPHAPAKQRRVQRQDTCTSVAAAGAKDETELGALHTSFAPPLVASAFNAFSTAAEKAGKNACIGASSQSATAVETGCLVSKALTTGSDVPKPPSSRALNRTIVPASSSAAVAAGATAATSLPTATRLMNPPVVTKGCETRSAASGATPLTTQVTAAHVTAGSHVTGPRATVSSTAAGATSRSSVDIEAGENVCTTAADGLVGSSIDEAAVGNGAAEETTDLKAWERQLLLHSPGALVLQQAPTGVSRAELAEFFRKFGPLQPPGDGIHFPNNKGKQLLVRFQRLQDAAKCVRMLQQQQQRRQAVRGTCGGYGTLTTRSGKSALGGALNQAADVRSGESTSGFRDQPIELQDVLQQGFQTASVSTSNNTTAMRLQSDGCTDEADCFENTSRSLSTSWLLGCASLQLSRTDKIKISALRGHRRALQLLRCEKIIQNVQQQLHRSEPTRVHQEEQSQIRKPQEQQVGRFLTNDRPQQNTSSAQQLRSTSGLKAGCGSAGPAAPAQQQQEGCVRTKKAVSTTQEGTVTHLLMPRERASAGVTGAAKGEKSPSPSRGDTNKEEKDRRVKRRGPQLPDENSSASDVAGTLTRQQQAKHAVVAIAPGAGATGRSTTSAAAASRAQRQSSSNSLLELLSGAAVAEHLEKEEAAAAGWGNNGASAQNSKLQQQRSQTTGWGEAPVLDPILDADRIHYLR